jgi:hypothetical protein
MPVTLPDWLTSKELAPAPDIYDRLPPARRACLKSQIALLYKFCSGAGGLQGSLREFPGQGAIRRFSRPRAWAVFFLHPAYASPAGLTAALLPARLAGVEQMPLCRLGGGRGSLHPALSAAAELLGQEDIFRLGAAEARKLVEDLQAQTCPAEGVLVFLGEAGRGAGFFSRLPGPPYLKHILPSQVRLLLDSAPEPDLEALLRWLHPGAEFLSSSGRAEANLTLAETVFPSAPESSLALGRGLESFWLWPELEPRAFRRVFFTVG